MRLNEGVADIETGFRGRVREARHRGLYGGIKRQGVRGSGHREHRGENRGKRNQRFHFSSF